MNFDMAAEMADGKLATVITDDDVAVETSTYSTGRRGVAGTLIVEKMRRRRRGAGRGPRDACSISAQRVNAADPLDGRRAHQLHRAGRRQADLPLGEDEMEMGVGIHGEPGRRRVKLASADAIADEMMGAILGDLTPQVAAARCCCWSTASAARRRWSSI